MTRDIYYNCRKVLEDIFDYSDLDGNGLMSRKEFNLFNIRTSGEEVADEEWQVVEGITSILFFHLCFVIPFVMTYKSKYSKSQF